MISNDQDAELKLTPCAFSEQVFVSILCISKWVLTVLILLNAPGVAFYEKGALLRA